MDTVYLRDVMSQPSRNGLTKPKRVRGAGVKMVNMGELFANRRIHNIKMDRVPLSENERISLLEPFDLLFARQSLVLEGAGQCSIFLGDTEDVCFESHIIRVRLDRQKVDPRFIFYWMSSPEGKHAISSKVEQGAGASGIRASDLQKVQITIPSLQTQKNIADILETIDEKIELNKKVNSTLEQMGQIFFRHHFIDNPDSKIWEKVSIIDKKISSIIKTGINSFDGEKLYAATANVSGNKISGKLEKITYKKRPSRANMQPLPGSIWFARMLGEHKALIVDDDDKDMLNNLILSTGFLGMLPLNIMKYYVWCYINSKVFANYKDALATGAVMVSLNNGAFGQIKIPMPSAKLLEEFNVFVKPIFNTIAINNTENDNLTALRDSLLPRLISGKIKI